MITKPGKEPITLGLFKFIGDFSQQFQPAMERSDGNRGDRIDSRGFSSPVS
jgi:hypothetical protein